jgi:shikimate kinase
MRIYLIGFMGTGKSTLGYQVASALGVPFFDTDQMIEEKTGMPITSIFSEMGEDEFRKLEAEIVRSTSGVDKALIATGGGLPVYHHNMEWLNENGITMYLEWPEEILLASLVHHRSVRPLLSSLSYDDALQRAMYLLEERKPVYEKAAMTIQMEGDIENDLKVLTRACKYIW